MAKLRDVLLLNGLRWSTISALMRYRISQAASIIPVAGYALLWSDSAEQWLKLQSQLRPGAFFTVNQRLTLIYVGSIFLTAALVVFWWRCPRAVQRHAAIEDYIVEQMQTVDRATWTQMKTKLEPAVQRIHPQERGTFTDQVRTLVRANCDAHDLFVSTRATSFDHPTRGTLFRATYLVWDETNFGSTCFVTIVLVFGLVLFLLPSLEVFYLVVRMIWMRAVG